MLKAISTGGNRLDERRPFDFRPVKLFFDPQQRGLLTVCLGEGRGQQGPRDTLVTAMVTATVTRPFLDRPAEGSVTYHVALSPTSVPDLSEYEEEEARLQRMTERILKNTRIVDTESLCILPGEQVWSVRVEVKVSMHGGNCLDAVILAAVGALTDYRRPEVTVDAGTGQVTVHDPWERQPIPLVLHNAPLSTSFALVDVAIGAGDHATRAPARIVALVDPLQIEEALEGVSQYTVALSRHGEVVALVKRGGEAVNLSLLLDECLTLARSRTARLMDMLQAAMIKTRLKP